MSSRKQKISPVTEKAFSQSDSRGVSSRFARDDHTHGTPADPVDTHKGEADPHPGYRLESEDHNHEASGAPGGKLDHGDALDGLSDDDHAQYHNDARGDARYFTEAEHIDTSAGVADAGKPIKLDAGGHIDDTMVNDPDIDHGAIGGLGDDDHTQYIKHSLATAVNDFLVASGAGAFIKKTLAEVKTILGLGSAAYTDAGDYAVAAKGVTNGDTHDHAGGDGAQIDHGGLAGLSDDDHTQYRLESEDHSHQSTGAQGGKIDHGLALDGLSDDDHTQYVLADLSRMATGEYRHVGNVADDATFNLPAVTNGGMGLMVAGADEERAQFSIKSDGTVNLIMASANVVANADTDAMVCIGTSVASPCVIKNRLGATKAILLQLWYN